MSTEQLNQKTIQTLADTPAIKTQQMTVPVDPVAQPRHRARAVQKKGQKPIALMYLRDDEPVHEYKKQLQMHAKQFFLFDPLDCELTVKVTFVFKRQATKTWKTKPMPRYRHAIKPDMDNLLKSTFDALNEIVWTDDKLICDVQAEKFFAAGHEGPSVTITVSAPEANWKERKLPF